MHAVPPRFVVHWGRVADAQQPPWALRFGPELALFALWPAPVNADACFAEAGFTDFDDASAPWEHEATSLWQRLLQAMQAHGAPRLLSSALAPQQPWHQRLLGRTAAPPHPLLEQLELPMQWDSLPACEVVFGEHAAGLRSGHGHVLCWVLWPAALAANFEAVVHQIACGHPVQHTPLKWKTLLGA